eukprot:1161344-Pelagomonas_calceolata.AAC.1
MGKHCSGSSTPAGQQEQFRMKTESFIQLQCIRIWVCSKTAPAEAARNLILNALIGLAGFQVDPQP